MRFFLLTLRAILVSLAVGLTISVVPMYLVVEPGATEIEWWRGTIFGIAFFVGPFTGMFVLSWLSPPYGEPNTGPTPPRKSFFPRTSPPTVRAIARTSAFGSPPELRRDSARQGIAEASLANLNRAM